MAKGNILEVRPLFWKTNAPKCPSCGEKLKRTATLGKARLNPNTRYKNRFFCLRCRKWLKREAVTGEPQRI